MENVQLSELPPAGGPDQLSQQQQQGQQQGGGAGAGGGPQPPPPGPGVPQLPPQMFTTAAQLLDLTDKKLLLVLRDGRKLIGVLRSWDQFANLVLQDTIERIFVNEIYADIPRGIFLVRGENVLLLGEIDLDRDDYIPAPFRRASPEEVHALTREKMSSRKRNERMRIKKLGALGFEVEHAGEVLF